MRVTLDLPATGPARLASPTKIADWNFYNERLGARYWDVAPDGRLIVIGLDDGDTSAWVRQINVVTNWFEELKRLVPVH
jgi:hypothetical protein